MDGRTNAVRNGTLANIYGHSGFIVIFINMPTCHESKDMSIRKDLPDLTVCP